MEFNSSYDQTNFMGYYPPSPISNGGWEYHQENTNFEHSNPWRFASETQDEQENHMGYFPPPQNDASHYSNGGWEYYQEMINDQVNHMRYCLEPQNNLCHYPHGSWAYQQEYEQSSEMNYFPEPQSDSYCYDTDINCGWEGNFNISSSVHQGTSSFDCAVNAYMKNCSPMPQDDSYCDEFNNSSSCAWENQNQKAFDNLHSTYQKLSSLKQTFNLFMESCQTSPPSFSSENSSSLNYPLTQNLFQNSQSTQTSMNQSLSRLETMLERYEREAQRSWNDQENSLKNMEVPLSQMLSAREEVEKQEQKVPVSSEIAMKDEEHAPMISYSQKLIEVIEEHETSLPKNLMEDHVKKGEEANQGSLHSIKVENYKKEELTEPSIQKALDEENTPTITQPPRLGFKKVKAINKSTEKRIVSKLQRTIFMKKRRSTTSNPPP
ncbi:uncharacterized protein DS421_14g463540 [Arachis hypogaea]|nr:uncharacterized protein DS421_14g463540 [Arachis hypogaea]